MVVSVCRSGRGTVVDQACVRTEGELFGVKRVYFGKGNCRKKSVCWTLRETAQG